MLTDGLQPNPNPRPPTGQQLWNTASPGPKQRRVCSLRYQSLLRSRYKPAHQSQLHLSSGFTGFFFSLLYCKRMNLQVSGANNPFLMIFFLLLKMLLNTNNLEVLLNPCKWLHVITFYMYIFMYSLFFIFFIVWVVTVCNSAAALKFPSYLYSHRGQ